MISIHNEFAIVSSSAVLVYSITSQGQFNTTGFEIQGKGKITIKPKGPNLVVSWTWNCLLFVLNAAHKLMLNPLKSRQTSADCCSLSVSSEGHNM